MARSLWGSLGLAVVVLTLGVLTAAITPATTQAQNCNALSPSGSDDWPNIDTCLRTTNRVMLSAGKFKISQPIVFPRVTGVMLSGAGNSDNGTVIVPGVNEPSATTPNLSSLKVQGGVSLCP
jgi:hypothetical protein